MMPGVAPAADEPDEPGLQGKERLQGGHQVLGVVVRVDGVHLGAEGRRELAQRRDRRRPGSALEAVGPGFDQHGSKAHLGRPPQERCRHGRGAEHDQGGRREIRLQVDLDRAEVVAIGAQHGRAGVGDSRRVGERGGVELAAAQRAGQRGRS